MEPRYRTTKSLVFVVTLLNLTSLAVEPIAWEFSADTAGWKPRAKSIVLTRVAATREGSQGSLRIQGRIDEGYNYALSERRPMLPDQLYRLSVWVRVERIGPGTPMPYLKCEFVAADNRDNLGQVHTDTYEASRLGNWQQLSAEFRAPEGTAQFWLALEKGTSDSAEIDAYLDTIHVEPIHRLSLFDAYRLDPIPPLLEKVRGVHPRLYLDAASVADLRQAIHTTHAPMWKELLALADRAVKRGAPAYREHDSTSGDEQLWQRDVGNTLPVLAMAWVLSGDTQYLDAVRQWALASCAYPTWGLGSMDGMDLAAGHQLFGLGLVYDWCYADLGETACRTIRETLVRRTSAMFEAAATGKAWWRQSYLQNHLWVNVAGMAVAGLALFDEVDDAAMWVGLPLDKFQRTMAALGSDGASHEGVGYWEYGVEYMLKFMDLARPLVGVNLYDHDWWRNTANYGQYLSLPRSAWTRSNCIVDIADCPRGHWYGPDYLLRGLAREFHDEYAQWLAQQIDDADVPSPGASWLNLVWFDPTIPATPPLSLPTLRYFDDMDMVSARSDWSGRESLVVFKCGPFIGHEAVQAFSYDPGGGHVHPDANHFVLFGAGEWLIRDDGYRAKWTGQHNTLLVEGRGQLGEGKQWFQGVPALAVKARPKILRVASSPTLDQMSGDATEAYASELGLCRYVRHLLYLKPDVLLVCDEVTTDLPRLLELRFHPESRQAVRDGNAYVLRGDKSVLRLEPLLTAADVQVLAEDLAIEGRQGEPDQTMFTLRLNRHAANWRNAVALSWSDAGSPTPRVIAQAAGDVWTFSMNGRIVTFDWTTGMAQLTHEGL